MTLAELVAAIESQAPTLQSIVSYSTFCAWLLSRSAEQGSPLGNLLPPSPPAENATALALAA
jgi:hypothetical protein